MDSLDGFGKNYARHLKEHEESLNRKADKDTIRLAPYNGIEDGILCMFDYMQFGSLSSIRRKKMIGEVRDWLYQMENIDIKVDARSDVVQ